MELDDLCTNALASGLKAIALVFEQGDDLMAAKAACVHGEWAAWLKSNFQKSQDTAGRYMKMALVSNSDRVRILKDAKSINGAFRMLGIIPPEPKQIGVSLSISIPPEIQKLNWLAEFFVKNAPKFDEMTVPAKEELKTKLKPIVAIYESL